MCSVSHLGASYMGFQIHKNSTNCTLEISVLCSGFTAIFKSQE